MVRSDGRASLNFLEVQHHWPVRGAGTSPQRSSRHGTKPSAPYVTRTVEVTPGDDAAPEGAEEPDVESEEARAA